MGARNAYKQAPSTRTASSARPRERHLRLGRVTKLPGAGPAWPVWTVFPFGRYAPGKASGRLFDAESIRGGFPIGERGASAPCCSCDSSKTGADAPARRVCETHCTTALGLVLRGRTS